MSGYAFSPGLPTPVNYRVCLDKIEHAHWVDITTFGLPFRLYYCNTCTGFRYERHEPYEHQWR